MKNNYNEFDTLSLYVKINKKEEIVEHYKHFKWELESEALNSRYEDIIDLTFTRPHKIENKDELQLLQVYMEDRLNNLAKLEKDKYAKATAFGLFFGVVGLVAVIFSLIFFFNMQTRLELIIGIIFGAIGFVMIVVFAIFLPKFIRKDKDNYNIKKDKLTKELNDICDRVKLLVGGGTNV